MRGGAGSIRKDARFDLFPFAGCTSTIGALDIADVTLPQPAETFADESPFSRIVLGLSAPPYRATNRQRRYLVYWDAPVSDARVCGQASATGIAIIYMRACGLTVGNGDLSAAAAAHELIHALGGVGFGAPHECPRPNEGHVCDDTTDILYPFLNFGLDALFLDVNHDDYYGYGGEGDLRDFSVARATRPSPARALGRDRGRGQGTGYERPGRDRLPRRLHVVPAAGAHGDADRERPAGEPLRGLDRRVHRERHLRRDVRRGEDGHRDVRSRGAGGAEGRDPRQGPRRLDAGGRLVPRPLLRKFHRGRRGGAARDSCEGLHARRMDRRVPRPRRVQARRACGLVRRGDVRQELNASASPRG